MNMTVAGPPPTAFPDEPDPGTSRLPSRAPDHPRPVLHRARPGARLADRASPRAPTTPTVVDSVERSQDSTLWRLRFALPVRCQRLVPRPPLARGRRCCSLRCARRGTGHRPARSTAWRRSRPDRRRAPPRPSRTPPPGSPDRPPRDPAPARRRCTGSDRPARPPRPPRGLLPPQCSRNTVPVLRLEPPIRLVESTRLLWQPARARRARRPAAWPALVYEKAATATLQAEAEPGRTTSPLIGAATTSSTTTCWPASRSG